VFVPDRESHDVSVLDAEGFAEVDRYDVGVHPDGIAYLPGGPVEPR